MGNKQRATASTGMNEKSSRSHSVVTVVITQTEVEMIDGEAHEHSRKSKVNLVDLAGSERINISRTTGARTKVQVHFLTKRLNKYHSYQLSKLFMRYF